MTTYALTFRVPEAGKIGEYADPYVQGLMWTLDASNNALTLRARNTTPQRAMNIHAEYYVHNGAPARKDLLAGRGALRKIDFHAGGDYKATVLWAAGELVTPCVVEVLVVTVSAIAFTL